MCTQPCRNRVGSHCLRCHKQTDDGRVVYITCIPTTCCGEIILSPRCRNCLRDPDHAPFRKDFSSAGGTCYVSQCTKFEVSIQVHPLRSCEWRCKMQKMGWFGVIRGHSRSWAMPPFDRAHTTSYSTSIETMCLSFTACEI